MLPARIGRFASKRSDGFRDRVVEALVADAYRNVNAFRERLDRAGVRPGEIGTVCDLEALPLSSREDYVAADAARSLRRGTRPEACHRARTSGTSGTPLIVHMNRAESLYRRALLLRAFRRGAEISFPLSIADVGVNVVRTDIRRGQWLGRLGVVRLTRISRFITTRDQVRILQRDRPQVITGPPSALELVAQEILDTGILGTVRARLVAPRGEVLRPNTRTLLEQAFGCRVMDLYSTEETGNVAWECPDHVGRFHVNADGCVVEIVDDDGHTLPAGSEGRVVITNLFNRTMPFIRYLIGDRAELLEPPDGPCRCGFTGSSLAVLAGRDDDFITLPTGRRISPRTVVGLVYTAARYDEDKTKYMIRRFRVEQWTPEAVRVSIIPNEHIQPSLAERLRASFATVSPTLRVEVEVVEDIPVDEDAKFRAVISHI